MYDQEFGNHRDRAIPGFHYRYIPNVLSIYRVCEQGWPPGPFRESGTESRFWESPELIRSQSRFAFGSEAPHRRFSALAALIREPYSR